MDGILVVVPCGRAKIWDKNPGLGETSASQAYTGAPFKVNRAYAERFAERWVILSARYGFVPSSFIIPGPYNVTFKKKTPDLVAVPTLVSQIREQGLHTFKTVIVLGGKEYRAIATEAFKTFSLELVFPFAGATLGKAMQFTKRAIEFGSPFPISPS